MDEKRAVSNESTKELFDEQRRLINFFFDKFDPACAATFSELALKCTGVLIFSGVGKSGFIANKIAMSLASTCTKAIYLNPLDALHGDIGMLSSQDILILLSKSGNTEELLRLVPVARNRGAKIVSITCSEGSILSQKSDLHILLPLQRELCRFNTAPVTSTILQLIFGDTVTVALMEHRKLDADAYARNHPAGAIGRRLLLTVADVMKTDGMPCTSKSCIVREALLAMTSGSIGSAFVVEGDGKLCGIFTDGDLRRGLDKYGTELLHLTVETCMTRSPRATQMNTKLQNVMKTFNEPFHIQCLPVVNEGGELVGAITLSEVSQML